MKLSIELVPESCWYSNVRSNVSKEEWDILRKATYRQAGYVCEICGGTGPKWPVECHEIWNYDDEDKVQKLERLVALCPDCHSVKHFGLAQIQGRGEVALRHLQKVNGWTEHEAKTYVRQAFDLWDKRSEHEWSLDTSWLDKPSSVPRDVF